MFLFAAAGILVVFPSLALSCGSLPHRLICIKHTHSPREILGFYARVWRHTRDRWVRTATGHSSPTIEWEQREREKRWWKLRIWFKKIIVQDPSSGSGLATERKMWNKKRCYVKYAAKPLPRDQAAPQIYFTIWNATRCKTKNAKNSAWPNLHPHQHTNNQPRSKWLWLRSFPKQSRMKKKVRNGKKLLPLSHTT